MQQILNINRQAVFQYVSSAVGMGMKHGDTTEDEMVLEDAKV